MALPYPHASEADCQLKHDNKLAVNSSRDAEVFDKADFDSMLQSAGEHTSKVWEVVHGGARNQEVFEAHDVVELQGSQINLESWPPRACSSRSFEVFDAGETPSAPPPSRQRRKSGRDNEY